MISTQPPPTAPVVTFTWVASSARASSTSWTVPVPVPVGVTAEAGTRIARVAVFTGIDTDALAPAASSWPGSATVAVVA